MPFFIRKAGRGKVSQKGKKRGASAAPAKRARHVEPEDDSEIDSDEAEGGADGGAVAGGDRVAPAGGSDGDGSDSDTETAQDKRLRLAKLYLEEIKRQEEDADDGDVGGRLRDDVLEKAGRLQRAVADSLLPVDDALVRRLRCRHQQLPVTCLVVSADHKHLYTASKDACIVKWDMEAMKRVGMVAGGRKGTEGTHVGHTTHILSMAISSDDKYLVCGDAAALIMLWCPSSLERLHVFRGHRGPVTGLVFQRGTHQLFSAAQDRIVKVWSVDDRAYVESLFGHQDGIGAIDALTRERAVTCGTRDNTVRVWKLLEESQLVFNGRGHSINCVRLVNEQHFVTGGEDGMLCMWAVGRKRPISCVENAHGCDPANGLPRWISAVAALVNSDLVASGSWDGQLRLWRCADQFSRLLPIRTVAAAGFINAIYFSGEEQALRVAVACGQEHRLGRWWRLADAKNVTLIVPLATKRQQDVV